MRRWSTQVTYHYKGNRYVKTHEAEVEASGPEGAVRRAVQAMRKAEGNGYRIVAGYPLTVRVEMIAHATQGEGDV